MGVKITASGLNELHKKMQKLINGVNGEISKKATGRGAAIIRDEAVKVAYKAPAPYRIYNKNSTGGKTATVVQPGHVARSIIMKRLPPSERLGMTSKHIVTVSNSKEIPKGARQIATFVEYGINMSQAHPFMRNAYDSKKGESRKEAAKVLIQGVNKQWKK